MPTGYTACIDERDASFEEFVWRCARGMGALISLRDDPADAPIPEHIKPNTKYDDERIAELNARRVQVLAMTAAQLVAERDRELRAAHAERARWAAESLNMRKRYDAMRKKVEAWKAPTADHDGLKKFMLEQLERGMPFQHEERAFHPDPRDGETIRLALLQDIDEDLSKGHERRAKAIEDAAARNRWIKALSASVPMPEVKQ